MNFDYKKYLQPLEEWIKQCKEQKAYNSFGQCLMSVPDNVLEPIELLVENYIFMQEMAKREEHNSR